MADPQPVLGEQAGGVGVVRRHRGLEDLLDVLVVGAPVRARRPHGSACPDPGCASSLGRLGGEGQAEHLVGAHLAGQPRGRRRARPSRGLAGAGAGDRRPPARAAR